MAFVSSSISLVGHNILVFHVKQLFSLDLLFHVKHDLKMLVHFVSRETAWLFPLILLFLQIFRKSCCKMYALML